jgi:hypothetical protein
MAFDVPYVNYKYFTNILLLLSISATLESFERRLLKDVRKSLVLFTKIEILFHSNFNVLHINTFELSCLIAQRSKKSLLNFRGIAETLLFSDTLVAHCNDLLIKKIFPFMVTKIQRSATIY